MPTATKQSETYRLSSRTVLAAGDRLRFRGGGPVYRGDDGELHRIPLRGEFILRSVHRRGKRTWLTVQKLEAGKLGAFRTVYIAGRPYRRAGLLVRPYNVRKLRRPQAPRQLF